MTRSIFRSPADRDAFLSWLDARRTVLPLAVEPRVVETGHGPTHLLVGGAADAAPLVVLHGGNGSAVDMAAAWGALAADHRVALVHVPGEPNPSVDRVLPRRGAAPGRWFGDLLDGLGWPVAALAALSGGGAHALWIAAHAPERLSRMALVAPEGLVSPPLSVVWRVLWPAWRASRTPSPQRVEAMLTALFTPVVAPATVEQMGTILRHTRGARPSAARVGADDLRGFTAPVRVVAGGRDPLFPGPALIERARRVLPQAEVELVADAAHIDARWFAGPVFDRLRAFLRGDQIA